MYNRLCACDVSSVVLLVEDCVLLLVVVLFSIGRCVSEERITNDLLSVTEMMA